MDDVHEEMEEMEAVKENLKALMAQGKKTYDEQMKNALAEGGDRDEMERKIKDLMTQTKEREATSKERIRYVEINLGHKGQELALEKECKKGEAKVYESQIQNLGNQIRQELNGRQEFQAGMSKYQKDCENVVKEAQKEHKNSEGGLKNAVAQNVYIKDTWAKATESLVRIKKRKCIICSRNKFAKRSNTSRRNGSS